MCPGLAIGREGEGVHGSVEIQAGDRWHDGVESRLAELSLKHGAAHIRQQQRIAVRSKRQGLERSGVLLQAGEGQGCDGAEQRTIGRGGVHDCLRLSREEQRPHRVAHL